MIKNSLKRGIEDTSDLIIETENMAGIIIDREIGLYKERGKSVQ